jgi:hypothetical protein
MPRYRFALVAALAAVLLIGCSRDPLGRHAISGTVKVDGQPLAKGDISFQPVEGQATSGGSPIIEGAYSVPKDLGLVAGKYRVEIHAPVPGTGGQADENALPGDPPAPPKELIPAEWNSASTHTIDVRKQGPFEFDFDISTKAVSQKSKP